MRADEREIERERKEPRPSDINAINVQKKL